MSVPLILPVAVVDPVLIVITPVIAPGIGGFGILVRASVSAESGIEGGVVKSRKLLFPWVSVSPCAHFTDFARAW